MGILSKLKKLFSFTSSNPELIRINVQCDKCDEVINSVFRKSYDFQPTYGKEPYAYSVNKQLVCSSCYQSIDLRLEINDDLTLLNKSISGGEIINDEEEE